MIKPEPFARQLLAEDMLTTRTPEAHAWAVKEFRTLRSEGQFIPLGVGKQTVVFPAFDGGAEWGGTCHRPNHRRSFCAATPTTSHGPAASRIKKSRWQNRYGHISKPLLPLPRRQPRRLASGLSFAGGIDDFDKRP